jgi:hypothetical protein
MWPPSSPDYNPLDYFMWSEFEREVNKQPHNTLASLKAKISEIMTNIEREIVILLCQSSGLRLRLLWRPVEI